MTGVLLAAVVLVGALTIVNLLLTFGVVRRLREHEARLAVVSLAPPEVITIPAGQRVAAVTTSARDGGTVATDTPEPTLYGFFSPSCESCHDRLDDFRRTAADHPGRTVAVVVPDGGDLDGFLTELAGFTVVVEELGGPLTGAFGVQGFPAFAQVDADRRVVTRGFEPPRLTQPV